MLCFYIFVQIDRFDFKNGKQGLHCYYTYMTIIVIIYMTMRSVLTLTFICIMLMAEFDHQELTLCG